MRYFIFLLVLVVGVAGWFSLRSYRQQNQLYGQLEQLVDVLTTENDLAKQNAQNTLKTIEAAAAKNQNQPKDLALLHRAQALQTRTSQLLEVLQTYTDQLHQTIGNPAKALASRGLGVPIGTKLALSQGNPHRQAFEQQLAAYADTLRQLSPTDTNTTTLRVPAFNENTPVVEALADLCQLESEVLARQTNALRRLAKSVGVPRWQAHLVVTASAESNVVAPGDTYRAELGLASYYSASELNMHMSCNRQPVPTDANGVGQVRFRAPTRLGPATWVGTIRVNQNGRDTTFHVTVPYRVVRR